MRVESVDTNVLMRLAIESPDDQTLRARALLASDEAIFSVSLVMLAEFVHVLMSYYGRTRAEAADSTRRIIDIESVICQRDVVLPALDMFETHPKLSFEDCLAAEQASTSGATPLWTFDTKLAKQHPAAKLVA